MTPPCDTTARASRPQISCHTDCCASSHHEHAASAACGHFMSYTSHDALQLHTHRAYLICDIASMPRSHSSSVRRQLVISACIYPVTIIIPRTYGDLPTSLSLQVYELDHMQLRRGPNAWSCLHWTVSAFRETLFWTLTYGIATR